MNNILVEISEKLYDSNVDLERFSECIAEILMAAEAVGIVVTVECRPFSPLAMGNHYPVIVLSPKRIMSDVAHGWRNCVTGQIVK